jgi:pyruvate ferredoxin oxidoreductase gamma subunit
MYRIRFHGRGGQGVKTAGRVLGMAFFLEGFEVQDAPRYGAERRGAPISAYVRASREPILERGVIDRPDLVVVIDETLVPLPAAGVLQGVAADTVMLLKSGRDESHWRQAVVFSGPLVFLPALELPASPGGLPLVAVACAAAAARLTGAVSRPSLEEAVHQELSGLGHDLIERNRDLALQAFDVLAPYQGLVREHADPAAGQTQPPQWVDLAAEPAGTSAPTIHAGSTSVLQRTGLWRTQRPVIDLTKCNRCSWVCGTYCPDNAITVDEQGFPHIDYEHCKGCMICLAQCPPHAIGAILESEADEPGAESNP